VTSPAISVVVPVFNGQKYLAKTLDSLLAQTFADYEILCIDDCSTDDSKSILAEYGKIDSRIRVMKTEDNQGFVPRVLKKYGLPNIRGEYYVYSSQDDLFSRDWLEKLIERARETGADAVLPDLVFYYEDDLRGNRSIIGLNGDRDVVLTNEQAVVLSLDWTIPGNALWRASLVKRVGYEDFGMHADEYSARVFYHHCNMVVFCDGVFYYRQDNPNAITKKISAKLYDLPYAYFRLFQFLKESGYDSAIYERELMNSVTSLWSMNRDLLMNMRRFSEEDRKLAKSWIRKCYEAIVSCSGAIDDLKQKSCPLKSAVKVCAIEHGYSFFDASCKLGSAFKRLSCVKHLADYKGR
jgi:glycosyltransferase involved in cell wall biosynthesis